MSPLEKDSDSQRAQKRKNRNLSPRRRFWFRLSAILLGISFFVAAEAVLRFVDWTDPAAAEDPFVGFSDYHPLFVEDERGSRYEISKSRYEFFRPDSFPIAKSDNAFRIFCLGGSTVQGRPYAIETSFTSWLKLSLQAAQPNHNWEVINCGGVSYASYRLTPMMRELLDHQADLFIIYTGHNEFLEDRTYHNIKQTPQSIAQLHAGLSQLRIYGLARSICRSVSSQANDAADGRYQLSAEVEARLDYRGGLEEYHRDDQWRDDCIEHYENNLRRMIETANAAGVPILLINPVSNLKDSPPFKIGRQPDLGDDDKQKFDSLWKDAQAMAQEDLAAEVRLLQEAIAIDPRHAGVHYQLGKCYEALNRPAEAKAELLRAKEEDVCPLRMLEAMHEKLFLVAEQTDTPLVDTHGLISLQSENQIPGKRWLLDHVHPTIRGHKLIAAALMDQLAEMQIVDPGDNWENRRSELYQNHTRSLAPGYFTRGQERLRGLKRWTQGRAMKTRNHRMNPEDSKPSPP